MGPQNSSVAAFPSAGYDILSSSKSSETSESLLFYLQEFQAVVCKPCGFAIQPNAISQHLKAKHKIYRRHREDLLQKIRRLPLANPLQVGQDPILSSPVPYIPVLQGYACNAFNCDHLCNSLKRMKKHWSEEHGRLGDQRTDWREVRIQTLFRGNCVRYMQLAEVNGSRADGTSCNLISPQKRRTGGVMSPSRSRLQAAVLPMNKNLSTQPDLNLLDLSLLHFYITKTGHTIQLGEGSSNYYTETVPQMASECSWLMRLVLAVAALHKAVDVPSDKEYLREMARRMAVRYHLIALPSYREALSNADAKTKNCVAGFGRVLLIADCGVLNFQTFTDSNDRLYPSSTSTETAWNDVINHMELVRKTSIWGKVSFHQKISQDVETTEPEIYDSDRRSRIHGSSLIHSSLGTLLESEQNGHIKEILLRTFDNYLTCINSPTTFDDRDQVWKMMWQWAESITPDYIDVLKRKNEKALVLLAYTALVKLSVRDLWYMKNLSQVFLQTILCVRPELRSRLSEVREIINQDSVEYPFRTKT